MCPAAETSLGPAPGTYCPLLEPARILPLAPINTHIFFAVAQTSPASQCPTSTMIGSSMPTPQVLALNHQPMAGREPQVGTHPCWVLLGNLLHLTKKKKLHLFFHIKLHLRWSSIEVFQNSTKKSVTLSSSPLLEKNSLKTWFSLLWSYPLWILNKIYLKSSCYLGGFK